MGLSLKKIGASIGSVLSGMERQINPFDNGASYSNPHPNTSPAPSIVSQINNRVVAPAARIGAGVFNNTLNPMGELPTEARNFAFDSARGLLDTGVNIARTPLDAGLMLTHKLALNNPALKNNPELQAKVLKQYQDSQQHLHQDTEAALSFPRFVPRALVQLAASVPGTTPHTSDNVYHPDNKVTRAILGGEDIPSLENVYKTTPGGLAKKVVVTGGTAAMDAAAAVGAGKSITKAGKPVVNLAQGLGEEGFLKIATNDPRWMGLNDHIQTLNQNREKMSAIGMNETHPAMKQNTQALTDAIKARDLVGKEISQRGSVPIPGKPEKANVAQSSGKPKVTLKEQQMGDALGMSPKLVAEAKADVTPTLPVPSESPKVGNKNVLERTQMALDANKKAPTPIKLPEVTSAKDAIRVADSLGSDFEQRATQLANAQDKLLGKNLANRDLFNAAIEHPEQAPTIAKQFGGNEQAFKDLVTQHQNLTNLEHASQGGAGNGRPFNTTYVNHNVDLSTPEAQAKYDVLTKTIRGGTAKSRLYPTVEDLRANGLDIKPVSAGDATRQWASRQSTIMRDAALENRLKTLDPGLQVTQVPGERPRFTSGDKAIAKQLKGVQPGESNSLPLKVANTLNTGLKQLGLAGGGFHDVKVSLREATQELASGRNPVGKLLKGSLQLVSPGSHAKWVQKGLDSGYGKIWADAGVAKTNLGSDLHGAIDSVARGDLEKFNPYMKGLFQRKIDYFKKQLVIDEAKRAGITPQNYNPLDAGQRKIINDIGDGAANWFGGENQRVLGKSPAVQQVLKFATLAPDFTEGKVRAVGKMFTGGAGGSLARRQVISEAVGVAILAEVGSKVLTGKFNDPLQALINPQVSTNMKDQKGRPLAVGLPGSAVADINRLITDPGHFAQSHLGAGASVAQATITGKDYYGDPLVDPFKNANPNFGDNLKAALASKGTIPGVQIAKTLQGRQGVETAVINTLGGRVGLDQNAPSYKETQAYYKSKDSFTKTLDPNETALFNKLNPTTKDRSGASVFSKTPLTKAADYGDLVANPDFAAKYQAYQKSQKSHDPLWDLNPDQLRSYMQATLITKNDPGGDPTTTSALYKRLPGDFFNKRSAYFDGLKAQGVNIPQDTGNSSKPQMPDKLVQFSLNYHNLPYGTGARSAALRSADGVAYIAYLNQNKIYNNQERADLGLPPLEDKSSQYSSRYGSRGNTGAQSVYKYAISRTTGSGKNVGANLSVKSNGITGKKSKVASVNKPKVSIKKSRV